MNHWQSFMIEISHRDTYTRNHYNYVEAFTVHLLIYKFNVYDNDI